MLSIHVTACRGTYLVVAVGEVFLFASDPNQFSTLMYGNAFRMYSLQCCAVEGRIAGLIIVPDTLCSLQTAD